MRRLLMIPAIFLLAACESPRSLVIESDAEWDGGIFGAQGSRWIAGTGNARITMDSDERCWAVDAVNGGVVRARVEGGDNTITGIGDNHEIPPIAEGSQAYGCIE